MTYKHTNFVLIGIMIVILLAGAYWIGQSSKYRHTVDQQGCYRYSRLTISDDKMIKQCGAEYIGSKSSRDVTMSSKFLTAWQEHENDNRSPLSIAASTLRYDQDTEQCYAMVYFTWDSPRDPHEEPLIGLLFSLIPNEEDLTCNVTGVASP